MEQHSSMARTQRIVDTNGESNADDANYQRMTERFDYLWATAPSEHGQREMQKLLSLIERHETAQRDRAMQAGTEQKAVELPYRIKVAQNSST